MRRKQSLEFDDFLAIKSMQYSGKSLHDIMHETGWSERCARRAMHCTTYPEYKDAVIDAHSQHDDALVPKADTVMIVITAIIFVIVLIIVVALG